MKTPEELAEEYADHWEQDPEYRLSYDGYLAGYQAAKPQWISVKERLPRPGQEVLAFDNGIMRVVAISTYNKWHPYINGANCVPSHWMKLPKPPEEA